MEGGFKEALRGFRGFKGVFRCIFGLSAACKRHDGSRSVAAETGF